MTHTTSDFLDALRAVLDDSALRVGDAIPDNRHRDWSSTAPCAPLAWATPSSTGQVSALLRLCHEHRVPVVPQGGLTGLAGSAVPVPGSVVLSLDRMHAVESVDADARTLAVQAGATLQAVQEAAREAGCQFGVDLGARGSCQVGGMVSTNAGGNGVLQFGMMREQVLGLEVVLADGTVLDMMRPMIKNNTGYDLKHCFIGAEGTLGVVTRALLRLHPASGAQATALAAVPDARSALQLLRRLQSGGVAQVTAYELMWHDFMEHALACTGMAHPFGQAHPLLVLMDLAGDDEAALRHTFESVLGSAMEDGLVHDAVIAHSAQQAASLWRLRETSGEIPSRMAAINFDISVPLHILPGFAERCIHALSGRWPGHKSVRFGHLGDGNIHLSTDARTLGGLSPADAEQALEALVYGLVAEAGGSISAEHGIGVLKKLHLDASRTPAEIAAMRSIKAALDPHGILNPGKVFDMV